MKYDFLPDNGRRVPIILGTDWHTDCDDCVALRMLDRLDRAGYIRLLGVSADSVQPLSAASIGAFLLNDGMSHVEVGLDFSAEFEKLGRYQPRMAKQPSVYAKNSDCIDAVSLYRKLLAASEEKVDIVEIGFEQVLEKLLKSSADEFSPLNGKALVREKVGRLFAMAGKWDEPKGKEFNIYFNDVTRAAAAYVAENWQTPIVYCGFEVGDTVITGKGLKDGDMLKDALLDYGVQEGRCSWDPMTALLAAINDPEKAGYKAVYGTAEIDAATGENSFTEDENGRHCYVVKREKDSWYADIINRIICSETA